MPRSRSRSLESITLVLYDLVVTENAALLQHFIDKRRLPMVYMGYDGYIAQVFLFQISFTSKMDCRAAILFKIAI